MSRSNSSAFAAGHPVNHSNLNVHTGGGIASVPRNDGDVHGDRRPLCSFLKRSLSVQELRLAFMALSPALAKGIDEVSLVHRLEGKIEADTSHTTKPVALLTLAEYSAITKRSRSSLYLDMDAGRLAFVSVGRRARRIPMSVLEKLETEAFATKTTTIEKTANTESVPSVTRTNGQTAAGQQCVSLTPPPVQ